MKLINRIEIAYFRSIYKARLDTLKGTNVIFGRNDSGKSNILRALNLFFNYNTNPDQDFSFNRDFNYSRYSEASLSHDIRKFVYIKLWFNTPISYRSSLGKEFWVKKQWSVTSGTDPHIDSSITEQKYQQYLNRLLKQIRFYYIPAIKDRRIFENLQEQIYQTLSNNSEFSSSLETFSSALKDRTTDLHQGILKGLGEKSVISPPKDLSILFRSLDFITSGIMEDKFSLMLQRGDGIQVRHIPEILCFLGDKSIENYHIWGFEEPENSLELVNAIDEAKRLCSFGKTKNIQIFLTSHSPAFFSLEDKNVSRFFVSNTEKHGERNSSKIYFLNNNIENNPTELMGELPHLTVVSKYLQDANIRIRELTKENDDIAHMLKQRNRPIVFVEGESDKIIFEAAWEIFIGEEKKCDFEPASGTSKMESLAKDGRVIDRLAPGRKVFVIVDNDKAGRELYKNNHLREGGIWYRHNSNGVFWCLLPFSREFKACMNSLGIEKPFWPGSIENLFSPELKQEAISEGVAIMTPTPHSELLSPENYPKIYNIISSEDSNRLYILTLEEDKKIPFAQWITKKSKFDNKILEPVKVILEYLNKEINN